MLDIVEYLETCIGEECGETQQLVGKSLRFGSMDVMHGITQTNADRLLLEFHDIVAVYQMYRDNLDLPFNINPELLIKKKQRVYLYMLFSYLKGKLLIGDSLRQILCALSDEALPRYIKDVVSDFTQPPSHSELLHLITLVEAEPSNAVHELVGKALNKLIGE